jgi:alginate O-acetyltransferase complex protein AlgI
MLLSITGNYFFGLWVEDAKSRISARRTVALSVIFNLALLIVFKYGNFLMDNYNVVRLALGRPAVDYANIPLPIGISFFTFQAMSYVIDVYRKHVAAQRRWSALALYISLFPQLIAGPIVRYADIAREIVQRTISRDDFAAGIRIFLMGLGKKVLIANILSQQADAIFALAPGQLPCRVAWLGLFFYTMQLYFDFSGYSDMAIGLGRMLGFHFLKNFNYPYIAHTLTEVWQRWHISLSTWFRDYLFNPLGGYRCSRARAYVNLMVVFVLCGIWHGSTWNFVAFGFYQGAFMIIERVIRARQLKFFQSWLGIAYANFAFASSLVFFRAENIPGALGYFRAMFGLSPADESIYMVAAYLDPQVLLASAAAVVGSAPFFPWLNRLLSKREDAAAWALLRHGGCLAGLVLVLALCSMKLASGTHNPFIYFRF